MRIAILKPSALGDIAHALPVLSALRAKFPRAHISWVVNAAYEPLLVGHPHLDETVPFDRAAFARRGAAAAYALKFAGDLRRRRFDLVVDLQGLLRTGLMCAATGAPRKVGFAAAREGARHFYTDRVRVPDAARIHAVDRYWRVAEYLGAGAGPKEFIVPIPPAEHAAAAGLLAGLPRPWYAVAAGSRWATKLWPPAYFAELLSRAQRQAGGTVVFVGTVGDAALSQEILAKLPGPARDLCGKTPLPRLAAVLAAADVVIGNDTGPVHLAAALGRPCVVPYTCTRAAKHGPYGVPGGGVETTAACGGSYLKTCPRGMVCLQDLTPAALWPTLSGVLDRWPTRSPSASPWRAGPSAAAS